MSQLAASLPSVLGRPPTCCRAGSSRGSQNRRAHLAQNLAICIAHAWKNAYKHTHFLNTFHGPTELVHCYGSTVACSGQHSSSASCRCLWCGWKPFATLDRAAAPAAEDGFFRHDQRRWSNLPLHVCAPHFVHTAPARPLQAKTVIWWPKSCAVSKTCFSRGHGP